MYEIDELRSFTDNNVSSPYNYFLNFPLNLAELKIESALDSFILGYDPKSVIMNLKKKLDGGVT